MPGIGDCKPSDLMDSMLALCPTGHTMSPLFSTKNANNCSWTSPHLCLWRSSSFSTTSWPSWVITSFTSYSSDLQQRHRPFYWRISLLLCKSSIKEQRILWAKIKYLIKIHFSKQIIYVSLKLLYHVEIIYSEKFFFVMYKPNIFFILGDQNNGHGNRLAEALRGQEVIWRAHLGLNRDPTVSVISRDSPFVEWFVWFTTLSF